MRWAIFNSNNKQWGRETYGTEADAKAELKEFWKGVSSVRLDRFTIRQVTDDFGTVPQRS